MRNFMLITLLIVATGYSLASGQNLEFGVSLNSGFPQGTFKNNVESNGIGIDGLIAYSVPYSPVSVGLDLGFITYGSSTRKEFFNPNIPEVIIGVRTTNNIFTGHFFTRIEARQGPVRPYIDGLVGLHYLWTESKVEDDDAIETIASTTNFEDSAFSYGFGGGLKFKIAESFNENGDLVRWFIDLKGRYLFGGEADYLKEGALRNNNGTLRYDTSRSNTDIVTAGLGFIVQF